MSSKPKTEVRRTFYREGIIALEQRFRAGRLHGLHRFWHRNGQLAEEHPYRNGLLHGTCRQWNESGKLLGSYRMEYGTGTQRSWHDNGRLKQEFATVEGQFCGRSRMWLRDGTLISDKLFLFDRDVTPAQYRQAAAKDPRLPTLRGRVGKTPLNNRAVEKHTQLVFVQSLLARRNGSEARTWLNAQDKSTRALGRFKRVGAAVKFVDALYQAGAVKVIAPDIYHNQRGDQFADSLVVQLPKEAGKRKTIRAICAQLQKDDLGAFLPDKDLGESHLYISMG